MVVQCLQLLTSIRFEKTNGSVFTPAKQKVAKVMINNCCDSLLAISFACETGPRDLQIARNLGADTFTLAPKVFGYHLNQFAGQVPMVPKCCNDHFGCQ